MRWHPVSAALENSKPPPSMSRLAGDPELLRATHSASVVKFFRAAGDQQWLHGHQQHRLVLALRAVNDLDGRFGPWFTVLTHDAPQRTLPADS
jgi:hypothetical protein